MEFPIQYTRSKILNQLQVAQKYLHYLSYEPLVYGLQRAIDDLKEEVNVLFDQHPNDGDDNDFYITSGFDYLMIAEKPLEWNEMNKEEELEKGMNVKFPSGQAYAKTWFQKSRDLAWKLF